jgi:glyceraldehyde-3-phosphate dehydrogenase/erythrose-4-phosphate dehydrogenase
LGQFRHYLNILFLSEHTKFEKKIYKETSIKKIYPPLVETSGRSKIINLIDFDTGAIIESTDKFNERQLLKQYFTDANFKAIFDKAVDLSIQERIVKPFFNRSNLTDGAEITDPIE